MYIRRLAEMLLRTILIIALSVVTIAAAGDVRNVTPAQAQRMISQSHPIVLDVRTPGEYAEGHLRNAILLDWQNPLFRSIVATYSQKKTYIVYCRSGRRSNDAAALMQSMGFTKVYNMSGGIDRWKREHRRIVR